MKGPITCQNDFLIVVISRKTFVLLNPGSAAIEKASVQKFQSKTLLSDTHNLTSLFMDLHL